MGRNGEWLGFFLGVFSLSLTGHKEALCCAFLHGFNHRERSLHCLLAVSTDSGIQDHSRRS